MRQIDEERLEADPGYRFGYLAEFMGFGPEDAATIRDTAGALAPLVPDLVDAVYDKLHSYTATWRHFVPKQSGYEGPTAEGVESLGMNHPQIAFRKGHLARYFIRLVSQPYDRSMVAYLDAVGKMHTPKAGSKDLDVPLVQMNALLGFVHDGLTAAILGLGLSREREARTLRAFGKLLWLQNDMVTRHYT